MPKWIYLVLAAMLLATAAAAQSNPQWSAGAYRIEITPEPGYPTGGHGPAGDLARGYWNRLYARAFYIGDGTQGLILVSCDFFAVPIGLQAEVWKQVSVKATAHHVKQEGLVLAATHTHQGPGNYMTAQVHNEFGSAYSGYSKELFQFLAGQIGIAVNTALDKASAATLRLSWDEITPRPEDQFVLNRSAHVFMLNPDRQRVLDQLNSDRPSFQVTSEACRMLRREGEPEEDWALPGCPRLRAVDRRMTVLELLVSGKRIGMLVFFAVHPTALAHHAGLYNSDFTGQAVATIEEEYAGDKTYVGFFNGAEGDITARRIDRDVVEVRETSNAFRRAILGTLGKNAGFLNPTLLVRGTVANTGIKDQRSCESKATANAKLAAKPAFGAAGLGGGEGDYTILHDLGWREGARDRAVHRQGPKLPGLDSRLLRDIQLTHSLAPAGHFPTFLPVTYAELGGHFLLGSIPVEMSTAAAIAIRNDFEKDRRIFQLIGLANEYASYTATESEYAAQDYMGASTLFGPAEARFLRCEIGKLQEAAKLPPFEIPKAAVQPGPPHRKEGTLLLLVLSWLKITFPVPFGPTFVGQRRELPDENFDDILRRNHLPERHLPFFEWDEDASESSNREIEIDTEDGSKFDTADSSFLKVLLQAPKHHSTKRHWAVIWIRPLWDLPRNDKYKFRVTLSNHTIIESELFYVDLDTSARPLPVCRKGESIGCTKA